VESAVGKVTLFGLSLAGYGALMWIAGPQHTSYSIAAAGLPILAAAWLYGLRGAAITWLGMFLLHICVIFFLMHVTWAELLHNHDAMIFVLFLVTGLLIGQERRYRSSLNSQMQIQENEAEAAAITRSRADAILDSTRQISVLLNTRGQVLAYNARARKLARTLTGNTLRIGDGIEYLVSADLAEGFRTHLAKAQAGRRVHVPRTPMKLDGRDVLFSVTFSPITDHSGGLSAIALHMEDITDQVRIQRQLQDQIRFMQRLMDTVPLPMFYKGTDGRYTRVNRAYEQHLGLSRDDFIGHTVFDVLPHDIAERMDAKDKELLVNPGVQLFEEEVLLPDGSKHYSQIKKATVLGTDGSPAGIVGIVSDLTERRQREALQSVVMRISENASPADSLIDLIQTVHSELSMVMDAHNFYVALWDAESETYRFPYCVDEFESAEIDSHPPEELRRSLTDLVRRKNQPHLVTAADHKALIARGEVALVGAPSAVWLGVPLRVDGEAIGVMVVQNYEDSKRYGQDELASLAFVADHVARSIERKRAGEALRSEREFIERVAEIMPGGLIHIDRNANILSVNAETIRVFNRPGTEIIGSSLIDIFQFLQRPDGTRVTTENSMVLRCLQSGESEPSETVALCNDDGTLEWFTFTAAPLRGADGVVSGAIIAFLDVTEEKSSELDQRLSKASLEQASEIALWLDETAQIVHVNDAACRSLGYSRDQLLELHLYDLDRNRALDQWQSAATGSENNVNHTCQSDLYRRDGTNFPVEVTTSSFTFDKRPFYLILARDITQRRETEAELSQTQQWLDRVVTLSPSVVYSCGPELPYAINFISNNIKERFGYRPYEVYADDEFFSKRVHPDDRAVFSANEASLAKNGYWSCEYRFRHADGHWLWIYDEVTVLYDDNGRKTGLIGSCFDISERKRMEAGLQSRDRILAAVSAAADMLMRSTDLHTSLQDVLRELGEAADVSRVYIFENDDTCCDELCSSQREEWAAPGISAEIDNPEMQNMPYESRGFTGWIETLSAGHIIHGSVSDLPEQIRPMMQSQSIKSLAVVPIFVSERWWGFIGFDDCRQVRNWEQTEIDALRVAGSVIGSAIERRLTEQKLEERERFYRTVLRSMPAQLAVLDRDGTIISINDAWSRYAHENPDNPLRSAIGANYLESCSTVNDESITDAVEGMRAVLSRDRDSFEAEYATGTSNRRRWFSLRVSPLASSSGGAVVSHTDITERRKAEQALTESSQRLAFLFQQTPLGVIEWDLEGHVTAWNPAAERIFGYTSKEVIGIHAFELVVPEQWRDRIGETWQELISGRGGQDVTVQNLTRDGSLRWCEWHSTTLLDEHGKIIAAASLVLDVTDQRIAQEQLKASEERHRRMYNETPVMLHSVDSEGRILSVSNYWLKCFGHRREEVIGRIWTDFQTEKSREWSLETGIPQLNRDGFVTNLPCQFVMKDGSVRDILLSAVAERDGDGRVVGAMTVLVDVTEQKRAERELVNAREEYRLIFNSVPAMIWYKDTKNRILRANHAATRPIDRTPEEVEGHTSTELYGEMSDKYYHNDQVVVSSKQPLLGIVERIRTSNGYAWIKTDKVPLLDANDTVTGLLVISQDISTIKKAEQELRVSDEILRQMTDAIVVTSVDGRVERWLAGSEHLFGYRYDEIVGQDFRVLSAAPDQDTFDAAIDRALEATGHYFGEILIRRKDGSVMPVETRTQIFYDADAKPIGVISLLRDIRQRREAEDALRQSEERFRLLFESAPLGIISCDVAGRIVDINPTLLRIIGSPTVLSEDHMAITDFPPLAELRIDNEIVECLQQGQPISNEGAYTSEWGGKVHLRYLLTPIRGEDGETTGLQVMIEDISERIQSERELKKLSAAVGQSANAICITDTQGFVEYVNPHFSQLTGYSIMEVIGRRVSVLSSGRHPKSFYEEMWQTIMQGSTWSGLVQNRRRNGELYWERKTISPIFSDSGEIMNFLSIGEDITKELKAQESLAESDKLAAVGMLAAGVSHEFKNYLGGIIGNASYALEELEEGESLARETLEQIIDMGERANQVAMSLLTYSKAKPQDFTRENLATIIRNSINLVEKELKNRSIEIATYFDDVPEVDVSASKVQQLLLNLIINAEHAIDTSGVITIALLNSERQVLLKVGDTGSGVEPENITKIFDPFFSTKGVWGKDKLVGSGMGLSICRNIAREHGGDLSVESRRGIGTTFTLSLPVPQTSEITEPDLTVGVRRVLIFSLDKSMVRTYFEPACTANASLLLVDAIDSVSDDLANVAELVVIDSRFTGKVELLRVAESCLAQAVPYVMVNCGAMEYQMSDLYDSAAANFSGLPDFSRLLEFARRPRVNRTTV
jgi:PAS domain S-box-containing protein